MSRYVDIGHLCFLTPARTITIIDKIKIFCNDVNKTSTSIKLLATQYSTLHVIKKKRKPKN